MATPGLRERKKLQTRDAIARAAVDLFARQGFAATTLKQVAEAADVAPRTVSGHFPAKEDLVFSGYAELFADLEDRLTGREPGESAADALGAFLRGYVAGVDRAERERSGAIRAIVEHDAGLRAFERGLQERAERLVAAAVAVDLGVPADSLLPHMVGAATIAVLDALGRRIKEAPDDFQADAVELIDEAMAFIGAGVRGLAGRRSA